MKLSKETIEILKNWAGINSNLHVIPGHDQITVSGMKNVMSKVRFEESFPVEFAIWDLSKFLATLSLFDDPELDFQDKKVVISNGSTNVVYHYAGTNLVRGSRPDDPSILDDMVGVINFDMSNREFSELLRAASVLGLEDVCVTDNKGCIDINAMSMKDPTSNTYSIRVSENAPDASFKMYLKTENLKLLPGDYSISISDAGACKFVHKSLNLTYYIAMSSSSVYNG